MFGNNRVPCKFVLNELFCFMIKYFAKNLNDITLDQRCPALSPIVLYRQFKCGDKLNFLNFTLLSIFKILNSTCTKKV